MDITAMFDAQFPLEVSSWNSKNDAKAEISPAVRDYARALLLGKNADAFDLTEDNRAEAKAWCAECKQLIAEGEQLARDGVARDSLAFDNLKKRAKELALSYFRGSDIGIVVCQLTQTYDAILKGEAENATSRKNDMVSDTDTPNKWVQYPYLEEREYKLLCDVQKYASWGTSQEQMFEFDKAKQTFLGKYPKDAYLIDVATDNGQLLKDIKAKAYQYAFRPNGEKAIKKIISELNFPTLEASFVLKSFKAGEAARARAEEVRKIKKSFKEQNNGKTDVSPVGSAKTANCNNSELPPSPGNRIDIKTGSLHPNSILNLRPSKKWTIVSDETGSKFNKGAVQGDTGKVGRYAFVLIPSGSALPELEPDWHAVDKSWNELERVSNDLYNSGCGVLGVSVNGLYETNRNLWHSCIEMLLDVTLRLLPVDDATEISLNVEQRGKVDVTESRLLEKTMDDVMYHLSLVHPEKAAKIKLTARYIAKKDCPWNGYADLVAYSWGCGKDLRRAFKRFGWLGPCLVAEDPETVKTFHRCLDIVRQEGTLSATDWSALVTCHDATAVGSLMGALLRAYGEEARSDLAKWRIYLDYVVVHLDSKAIQMQTLLPQLAWLKEYEPDEASLPPRIRLLWLTARLAAENHAGGVSFGSSEHAAEFRDLCAKLKDEDAPLACFAALHLAVEKTDGFEFEAARELLAPWENEQVAVPGLRFHAQVLSSLGQHSAFLGDNQRALEYFKRALGEFSRLSSDWLFDYSQTCAYAVIAAMDCGAPELRELLAEYLCNGGHGDADLVAAAQRLASVGADDFGAKYSHAILLRYLVTLPAEDPLRKAYVDSASKWQWSDDGHPWEFIAYYRALLLGDTAEAVDWLRKGYELSANAGPTLKVISCVILGALLSCGGVPKDEYLAKVDEVEIIIPAIGACRIAALRAFADAPVNPLNLAEKVLPFNFR